MGVFLFLHQYDLNADDSRPFVDQGENVRHNVGCRTRNLDAIFVT